MNAAQTRGLLALAALALALTGQYFLEHADALAIGLLLFAAGGAALVAARPRETALFRSDPLTPAAPERISEDHRLRRLVLALLAALPFLALSLYRSHSNPDDALAWALHAASLIAFLYVLLRPSPAGVMRRLRGAAKRPSAATRIEIAAVGAILGLALLLRVVALENLPFGLWFDEAVHGMSAVEMLEDSSHRPIFVPAANLASPFIAVQAASVAALGRSATAVRLPSALLDVGFILLLCLLLRRLMGWRIALLVAFLVAVSSWDITWGRSGMPGTTATLLGVGVVFTFLWALRRNDVASFALAGMVLGSGFWFYQALRTMPAALILVAGFALVMHRPPARETLARAASFTAGAVLVAAPLLQYAVTNVEFFWGRAAVVTSLNMGPTIDPLTSIGVNLDNYLLMFNYSGDVNGRHGVPLEPMLSFGAGAMAVLGFLYCLSRPHRPVPFLLLVWFFVALLPGLITLPIEAPNSLRVVGALPVAYAFAGVGIAAIIVPAANLFPTPRHAAVALGVPLALGLAVTAYDNFHTYFHVQRDNLISWASFSPEQTEVARRLQALPSSDYDVVLSPYLPHYPVISYLVDEPLRIETFVPARHPPASGSGEGALVYFDTRQQQHFNRFEQFYPGRSFSLVDFGRGPEQPLLYSMEVDSLDVYRPQGIALQLSTQTAGQPADTEDRVSRIDFAWSEYGERLPLAAEWTGSLHVRDFMTYKLTLEGSHDATLTIGGAEVLSGPGEVEIPLAVGFHSLEVRDVVRDTDGRTRLTWSRPGTEPSVVSTPNLYFGDRSHGLLGTYMAPRFPEVPTEAYQQIDPMLSFFFHERPYIGEFRIRWEGGLLIDKAGDYGFRLDSSGPATLTIGDSVVVDNPGLAEGADTAFESRSGASRLSPGRHPIRVTFRHALGDPQVTLLWWEQGDEQGAVPIPPEYLVPAPPQPPK